MPRTSTKNKDFVNSISKVLINNTILIKDVKRYDIINQSLLLILKNLNLMIPKNGLNIMIILL